MRIVEHLRPEDAFSVARPDVQTAPFVFNSPHSGASYPSSFLAASKLDHQRIRQSEDAFVDRLMAGVVSHGAPLMSAEFPRAFLDVNREPYELDPKMFSGRLPSYANIRSVRVAGGLGTIARVVSESDEIYSSLLTVQEAIQRIDTYYKPYHATLRKMLAATQQAFGHAVLIDCHSMPSATRGGETRMRADIVLGDRYGTSCSPLLLEASIAILEDLGFAVAVNKPYAGGFITEHYGRPTRHVHALQIEINRGLYMDERTLEPVPSFAAIADIFSDFAGRLMQQPLGLGDTGQRTLAAE
ncbi:N-formylglutamate deformylase [Hartmannibacter diazotrophicus]|uniref:N-formylglutamate deformylase n=1 Tax=Hartmannibacter diazotrophicus TaxID=1482074 RepID=A0A2C9DCZ0_9HYPH|nr:N-formylglutamate amidohydrolase [Hartmannibacter diazotrophicus]SON57601.1 N-formylglutamate deformylase [Hartmannibacter diazotrophicus]